MEKEMFDNIMFKKEKKELDASTEISKRQNHNKISVDFKNQYAQDPTRKQNLRKQNIGKTTEMRIRNQLQSRNNYINRQQLYEDPKDFFSTNLKLRACSRGYGAKPQNLGFFRTVNKFSDNLYSTAVGFHREHS